MSGTKGPLGRITVLRIAAILATFVVVVVAPVSLRAPTVVAATYGNTDVYQGLDGQPSPCNPPSCIPSSQQRTCNLTSPIWSGGTCVNQRYGCVPQLNGEEAVTANSPAYMRVCLALDDFSWHFWHHGIDIDLPLGTWQYASISGQVVQNDFGALGIQDLGGHVVYFVHGDSQVAFGALVTVRDHIANTNCHLTCTAPHLHLEVHSTLRFNQTGGAYDDINPEPWLQYQGPRAAAVSSASNRMDVFVRGTGGAYQDSWNGSSWSWGSTLQLTPAGTTFAGQLSAVSNAPNQIFLYGIGTDGKLYQNYATNNTNWNGWSSLDQPKPPDCPTTVQLIGTPAAVAWASQQNLSIFARGIDGQLYHKYYSPYVLGVQVSAFVRGFDAAGYMFCSPCSPSWDVRPGGLITNDPAAISFIGQRLDVFVRGSAPNFAVYHWTWTPDVWSGESLGGFMT